MSALLAAGVQGFGLGAGLIIAIGAQNAFVLRQGLKRQHVTAIVITCALVDVVLMSAGVLGLGTLIAASRTLTLLATLGGAAFLIVYAVYALRAALEPGRLVVDTAQPAGPANGAVRTALAFSLLNPHVYLDTVVLVGSIGGQFAMPDRLAFLGGAICASFVWFCALGYGAALLAPLFARPMAWRVLDATIALVLFAIAASLLASLHA
ncbi:MAG: LysE/ArgO family amino acid transporter [Geminicoccaceae bacterium]